MFVLICAKIDKKRGKGLTKNKKRLTICILLVVLLFPFCGCLPRQRFESTEE